jgi:predicted aldo/keto reductase-like oxidoreductase
MAAAALPKMQYTNLGNTGCRVSRICLGCMSFGDNRWAPYVVDEKESLPLIKKAYDAGINFFDTGKHYLIHFVVLLHLVTRDVARQQTYTLMVSAKRS